MNLYNEVMAHDKIFSLLYSPIKIDCETVEEQICEIDTSKLE